MTTRIDFNTGDDVDVYRDGVIMHPAPEVFYSRGVTANNGNAVSAFGADWKRNASDYRGAINDMDDGGVRFILRRGDMRDADVSKLRERSELSGSGFAGPISGTYDADFTVTPHTYDSANWSSMVQIITTKYQPLLKVQARSDRGVITLDGFLPEFEEVASIPLLAVGSRNKMHITVSFETGYVHWFVNGATVYSGVLPGLAISGHSDDVYFKFGAYREGSVLETTVTDFHDVSFKRR